MIQIFIDGKPVIPKDGSAIRITMENPYFTKSATYSYEVELPMAIRENREVFGHISRMDADKRQTMMEACLMADNRTLLSGTAHITQVTEEAVKVQLLGEEASYNFGNKMEETFIDELDLGDWATSTWPDEYDTGTRFHGTTDIVAERLRLRPDGVRDTSGKTIITNLYAGTLPWVAFPVMNESAAFLCNGIAYRFDDSMHTELSMRFRAHVAEATTQEGASRTVSLAVQPYLWVLARKIAAATGFELPDEDNALLQDELFSRIFMVNTSNFIDCAKPLPHWSVNEWWTQVEQTFGLVMRVDYAARRMSLRRRADYFASAAKTFVDQVADEYTSEMDSDEQKDISSSGVGYADSGAGREDRLSDFVLENARMVDGFADAEALGVWAQSHSEVQGMRDALFCCDDGRRFIFTSAGHFMEVDMLRPRKPDGKDPEIELKIVPAKFTEGECEIYAHPLNAGAVVTQGGNALPIGSFPVRMLAAPGIADMAWYKENGYAAIDIEAIIDETQEEAKADDSKPDCIYMAIANLQHWDKYDITVELKVGDDVSRLFRYPRAYIRERTLARVGGEVAVEDEGVSLALVEVQGQENIASRTLGRSPDIDTSVRHCMKFASDTIPDTSGVFVIRNRTFVCEKIEAQIGPAALDRMLTGYFYSLRQG